MPTFILQNNPHLEEPFKLSIEDEKHLFRSLRAKPGDVIGLTNNLGKTAIVKIASMNPLRFELLETKEGPQTLPVCVGLPLIEKSRLEWAIEKLTELNVAAVQLLITERTQVYKFAEKHLERLQKISVAAQKQSGRPFPLTIHAPMKLTDLATEGYSNLFYASLTPNDARPSSSNGTALVLIGPEGGFTEGEETSLAGRGFQPLSLGPLVLRAETAAISVASLFL